MDKFGDLMVKKLVSIVLKDQKSNVSDWMSFLKDSGTGAAKSHQCELQRLTYQQSTGAASSFPSKSNTARILGMMIGLKAMAIMMARYEK